MVRRVLILSASIGTGHVKAAEALLKAFRQQDEAVEVRHEDALSFANTAYRKVIQTSYVELANKAPQILGFIYNYADAAWTTQEHGLAIQRWNSERLISLVKAYRPDAVLCTHMLPADMTSWLICQGRIKTQHAIVITDFDINPMWLSHHYARYFVAIEEAREHLVQLGYLREKIQVTGIPIDPVFGQQKDKRQLRSRMGLDQEQTTALLTVGGLGMGPLESILYALRHMKSRMQIIAVCGANEQLKKKVDEISRDLSSTNGNRIITVGYVDDMDRYMSASDLIIGKAGGLTSSEALSKGLAMVIVNPVPGQEERNADHLLEEGVAIRCNNLPALAYKVDRLLENPARLASMQRNALAMARPWAAARIAREVTALAFAGSPCAVHPANHKCRGALEFDLGA